jgi:hypothetical protein
VEYIKSKIFVNVIQKKTRLSEEQKKKFKFQNTTRLLTDKLNSCETKVCP